MRQLEPDPTAVNRLTVGPDGAVHVIPAGIRKASPPGEMGGQPAAAPQACESGNIDPPAEVAKPAEVLRDIRRVPEVGVCFSYSVGMPVTDRDVARQVLRGVRRAPDGGICFSYSAGVPATDRDAAQWALRDIRRVPGEGAPCFSY
jgi:hypothetical protein